jgi:hypothetical protein
MINGRKCKILPGSVCISEENLYMSFLKIATWLFDVPR